MAQAGDSHQTIAARVREKFGTSINPRSIGKHLKKAPAEPPPTEPEPTPTIVVATPVVPALAADAPIVESERLEAAIRRIENLLAVATNARDVAQLTKELRQSLRQLRMEKDAATERARTSSKSMADLRHQLLTLYAPTPGAPDDADRPEVPDERRASGGG